MHETVAIGLGSNLGDREAALASAIESLVGEGWVTSPRTSSVVESAAVGPEQPRFLNQVLIGRTSFAPLRLLRAGQAIERRLGRVRGEVRWGPRTIDIDLLAVGPSCSESEELVLPHPEISRRPFVLVPWAQIDPDFVVPGLGKTVALLLAALDESGDRARVEWWGGRARSEMEKR